MLEHITPVILAYNEEANIQRTLAPLGWAREVVVVDSGSTDGTISICESFANVRVVTRPFDELARQWTFAIHETGIASDWILALDADYGVDEGFVRELSALSPDSAIAGYRARFVFCIDGRPIRGSLYPPVTVLYRRERATYRQDGHTQRVVLDGGIEDLDTPLRHDDRKPFSRFLSSQRRYGRDEAGHIAQRPYASLPLQDRIRRLVVIAPVVAPLYALFVRGAILSGWPGLKYAWMRMVAEAHIAWYLLVR